MSVQIKDNQMHVHCERLYRGQVDIRSYDLKEAFEKNIPVVFHVKGEPMTMTVHPHEFNTKALGRSEIMQSRFSSQKYCLISYRWVPDLYTQMTLDQQESQFSAKQDNAGNELLMDEKKLSTDQRERMDLPFQSGWRSVWEGDEDPFPNPKT